LPLSQTAFLLDFRRTVMNRRQVVKAALLTPLALAMLLSGGLNAANAAVGPPRSRI
jgi:hypothetical protein